MRSTYLTAIVIAMLIALWLLSGQINSDPAAANSTIAERNNQRLAQRADDAPTRVRGRIIRASPQLRHLRIRGKTQNKRTVTVRAEIAGRIVERPVERGSRVSAGDLLCRISLEDRQASLVESQAALHQARLEYQGRLELQARGLQSKTLVAQAKARLAQEQAELKRSELNLARLHVSAPFAGSVEDVHQEVGDYVTRGAECATIIDLDPMLLVGRVPEKNVLQVAVGGEAVGVLSNGAQVSGLVSFVGQQNDPETRSYPLEIQIPNADYALRSGVTTEIRLPIAQAMAQKISPALFALDDAGVIGVRIVNAVGRVEFNPVEIIREDSDGVWVAGLPEMTTVITVGQELVVPGELVEVDFQATEEMPAAASPSASAADLAANA